LRRALWAEGLRFRTHYCKEKIDIAFPSKKLAIFVDGCFWHGCPIHSHLPKSHEDYWHPKLKKNIERDCAKNTRLEAQGWRVLRFWEHDLNDPEKTIERIHLELGKKGKGRDRK
ncbi:MAG: very short patch repair endonuclease, partial [Candidatus Hodarchaeota archaeon]